MFHEDGYQLPDDEPLMVFRGKDVGSLMAIYEYICMLEDQPMNRTILSHLESSLERLSAFYHYQINNPQLQSVGCSMKAHDRYKMFLNFAEEKLSFHDMPIHKRNDADVKILTGVAI